MTCTTPPDRSSSLVPAPALRLTRRRALAGLLGAGAAGVAASLVGSRSAWARPSPAPAVEPFASAGEFSVWLEGPGGEPLETFDWRGARFVAGVYGQAYRIRVRNHTGARLEAVVSVDGRDVVSGAVADFRHQRGYVLEPWRDLTIDGFRQSLDHVATFRFTDPGNSYSGRRGTPQHTGVIGVALFRERVATRRRPTPPLRPIAPTPWPDDRREEYVPYRDEIGGGMGRGEAEHGGYGGASGGDAAGVAPSRRRSSAGGPPPASAPGAAPSGDAAYGERWAAPAAPRMNELGTQYGETRISMVTQTRFQRRHGTRPDALATLYYDSWEGLRARGVPVDPPPSWPAPPLYGEPEPFPDVVFAPPPPPRRY